MTDYPWDAAAQTATSGAQYPWDANATATAPDMTLGREAGIAARGAYPVAAGATLGAGIGMLGGPAGAGAGAIVGGMALPAAEGLTSLYNKTTGMTGLPKIGSPTKAVEDALTKLGLPEPKSTAERAIQAAGAAVAGAGTQLPGAAALADAATSPVTRGVAQATTQQPLTQLATAPVAAATNQAVTEKTGSPVLGFLSSLVVGGAPALVSGGATNASRQDIYNQSRAAYGVVDNSGIRISPESFQDFVDGLPGDLTGYHSRVPAAAPQTSAILNDLRGFANEEDTIRFSDLDGLRSTIRNAAATDNPNDARLLGQIVDRFDNYIAGLTPDHLDVGEGADLDTVRGSLNDARALWQQNAKMGNIQDIMDVAGRRTDPGQGDLYIRQQFRRIASDPSQFNNYTPDEQAAITRISNQGLLGTIGQAAPHWSKSGMLGLAGHAGLGAATGNPLLGLGTAAGTYGAFQAAQALRRSRAQSLQNTIAGGGTAPSALDNSALQVSPLAALRANAALQNVQ